MRCATIVKQLRLLRRSSHKVSVRFEDYDGAGSSLTSSTADLDAYSVAHLVTGQALQQVVRPVALKSCVHAQVAGPLRVSTLRLNASGALLLAACSTDRVIRLFETAPPAESPASAAGASDVPAEGLTPEEAQARIAALPSVRCITSASSQSYVPSAAVAGGFNAVSNGFTPIWFRGSCKLSGFGPNGAYFAWAQE